MREFRFLLQASLWVHFPRLCPQKTHRTHRSGTEKTMPAPKHPPVPAITPETAENPPHPHAQQQRRQTQQKKTSLTCRRQCPSWGPAQSCAKSRFHSLYPSFSGFKQCVFWVFSAMKHTQTLPSQEATGQKGRQPIDQVRTILGGMAAPLPHDKVRILGCLGVEFPVFGGGYRVK